MVRLISCTPSRSSKDRTCALAGLLPEAHPLTVITNSHASAAKLIGADEVELISLGGKYHRNYNAYIGITCEKAVASLRANVLFCSASAIDGVTAFIQDAQVTKVKQAMMASSIRRILLVDSSKFGKVALNVLGDLTAFDTVLTTDRVREEERAHLRQAGVNLEIVKMGKTTWPSHRRSRTEMRRRPNRQWSSIST